MADWTKFRDNQYDDDGELLLGMKELNQRRRDLKMTEDELVVVCMLGVERKERNLTSLFIKHFEM